MAKISSYMTRTAYDRLLDYVKETYDR
jgi:hypothetical protein